MSIAYPSVRMGRHWQVAVRKNAPSVGCGDRRNCTLTGHTSWVNSVSFSPDGQTLASGSSDYTIRLWDVETGETVKTLTGHTGDVISVSFSPDGQTLASGSGDGTMLLWVVLTQQDPKRFPRMSMLMATSDLVIVATRLGQTGKNPADVNGDLHSGPRPRCWSVGHECRRTDSEFAKSIRNHLSGCQTLVISSRITRNGCNLSTGILYLEYLLTTLTPKETALLANYPNPFNPETWIPYQLANPANVTVTIYTANGQRVRRLEGYRWLSAYWDGRNAMGEPVIYFYTLTAGDFTATRKMLIRK